jgi:hypothetical protein
MKWMLLFNVTLVYNCERISSGSNKKNVIYFYQNFIPVPCYVDAGSWCDFDVVNEHITCSRIKKNDAVAIAVNLYI